MRYLFALQDWATEHWESMLGYGVKPSMMGIMLAFGIVAVAIALIVLIIFISIDSADNNLRRAQKSLLMIEGLLFSGVVSYLLGGWYFAWIIFGYGLWVILGLYIVSVVAKTIYRIQIKPIISRWLDRRILARDKKETQFPGPC